MECAFATILADTDTSKVELWQKKERGFIDISQILFKIKAGKSIDKLGKLYKIREMFVTEEYLFYEKSKDYWFPLRVVRLRNIMVDYEEVSNEKSGNKQFKLNLVSGSNLTTVFIMDSRSFNRIIAHISPKLAFMNFESKYRLDRMIDQKKLWSEFICSDLKTGQEYRVKVCNKDYLITKLHSICQIKNEINIGFKVEKYTPKILCYFESRDTIYLLYEKKLWTPLSALIPHAEMFDDSLLRYVMWHLLRIVYYLEVESQVIHKAITADTIVFDGLQLKYTVPKNKYADPPKPILEGVDLRQFDLMIVDFNMAVKHGDESHALATYFGVGGVDPEFLDANRPIHLDDSKSDLYSVAIVVCQIITGKSPVEGMNLDEAFKINQAGIAEPHSSEARFAVKQNLWDLLKKMMATRAVLRISVKEALMHPYFVSYAEYKSLSSELLKSVAEKVKSSREVDMDKAKAGRMATLNNDDGDPDQDLDAFMAELQVTRRPVDPTLEDGIV